MLTWMRVLPTMNQIVGHIPEPELIMWILRRSVEPIMPNQPGHPWDERPLEGEMLGLHQSGVVLFLHKHPYLFMISQGQVLCTGLEDMDTRL